VTTPAGCTACGHTHQTMAVVWHNDDTVTLLCHEDDHSCYEEFVTAEPPETTLISALRASLNPNQEGS